MSYEIIYDKQFIKVPTETEIKYIPLFYMGSNNCTEIGPGGRERRARSWSSLEFMFQKLLVTQQDMIDMAYRERERLIERSKKDGWDDYDDKRFGYHASLSIGNAGNWNVSFKKYKNLYTNGCRKAMTVEQLNEHRISVSVYSGYLFDSEKEKLKKLGKKERRDYAHTTKELLDLINEYKKYYKGTKVKTLVTIEAHDGQVAMARKQMFPKQKREKKQVIADKYYVVKDITQGNYVIKFTRYGYRYSYYGQSMAKKFLKESEAKRYAKKGNKKYNEEKFVVETVYEKKEFLVTV